MNVIHFRALTHRCFELLLSDKLSLITTILQAPLMLIVIAIACQTTAPEGFYQSGYWNAHTGIFILTVIPAVMGILNSYREVCKERSVLLRETATGLDAKAYIISKIAVQAVLCAFHTLILTIGAIILLKLPIDPWYGKIPGLFITIYLVMLSSAALGIFISCLLKNSESAILPILFIIMAQMVLSNTVITFEQNTLTQIISAPIVTKWGVAAIGHLFRISAYYPDSFIDGYTAHTVYLLDNTLSYVAMLLIILLSIIFSILLVKRIAKKGVK